MSLYRKTVRYKRKISELQEAFENNEIDIKHYSSGLIEAEKEYIRTLLRYRERNRVVADAFSGYRSLVETVREYTMRYDFVLPGTCTRGTRKMNRHLRRVLGIINPLEPQFFISNRDKIEREIERASVVDRYIDMYSTI
ncbi:MAG: hypothetical protein J7K54_04230 [Candidatus Aenigmarchaeota archaeon]|nr:hypothetical protein [Candidatus Aenigmarchaeota archaeon]